MGGIQRAASGAAQANIARASAQQEQIFEGHLRVVDTFPIVTVPNAIPRNFQRLTHRIEMKTNDSRRQPNGRYSSFRCEAANSGFAYLQVLRKLLGG